MLTHIFFRDPLRPEVPAEGDVYKILHIHGHRIVLPYGYYEDRERENPLIDPMPIYPDFLKDPKFTSEGAPLVTKMQDVCAHYQGKTLGCFECAECRFYSHCEDLFGICTCPKNKWAIQPIQEKEECNIPKEVSL